MTPAAAPATLPSEKLITKGNISISSPVIPTYIYVRVHVHKEPHNDNMEFLEIWFCNKSLQDWKTNNHFPMYDDKQNTNTEKNMKIGTATTKF